MNIGFDGKRAANNLTGLGNYSRSLIAQLAKHFHQNQYFVYSPKVKSHPQVTTFLENQQIQLKLPASNVPKLLWRSFGIKTQLQQDGIDLYHGLSQEIPLYITQTGIKTIVTMHDLIYLRLPKLYKRIDRYIYNRKSEYACKNSDHIVAISERTKQDIIEYYQVPASKITVIYQGCDPAFKQKYSSADKLAVLHRYALPLKYILIVGTIEPRKNLMLLVRALKNIHPAYKLVVVGKQQPYAVQVKKEIERLGLIDRVVFLEGLPFADLPLVYQMASLFVYPSFYEGFGIPIIEALHSRVPVIAATGSCLEEAGGPGSIYIAPDDAEALAFQANRVLNDEHLRVEMVNSGLSFVQRFNPEILTKQMMDCYIQTINS